MIKYIVVRISDNEIMSRHFHLPNARKYRESLRPSGGASLMYEIYKHIE